MGYVRSLIVLTLPCALGVAAACGSHEGEDRRALQDEAKSAADSAAKAKAKQEDANTAGSGISDAQARRGGSTERALDRLLRRGGDTTATPETEGAQRDRFAIGRDTTPQAVGNSLCDLPLSIASDAAEGRTRILLTGRFGADCAQSNSVRVLVKAAEPIRFVTPLNCEAAGGANELACRAALGDVLDANGDVAIEITASAQALRGLRATLTFE